MVLICLIDHHLIVAIDVYFLPVFDLGNCSETACGFADARIVSVIASVSHGDRVVRMRRPSSLALTMHDSVGISAYSCLK